MHDWNVTPEQAVRIQESLRDRCILEDRFGPIRHVGGVDADYDEGKMTTYAAAVVLTFPGLKPVAHSAASIPTSFPYIPGLLSFREAPAVLKALEKLGVRPDLLLCDGHGLAHPRRFGIASHIGILTGLPTVGVAKSRLTGTHEPLPQKKGSWVYLLDGKEPIGAVVRTRTGVKPVYVSPGHNISLDTAVDVVLRCTTRYRLPETTRLAHRMAALSSKYEGR